jgi:probable addiction module antidote protein
MVFGNCDWMSAQDIEFTMRLLIKASLCCYVAAIKENKTQISALPFDFGKTGKGKTTMRDRSHDDAMAEVYRDDPAFALQVLNSILEDGDQEELLITLRQMAKAFGGVQAIAEKAQINPTQLYRTLSAEGNPALGNFSAILKAMGMRLSVTALDTVA